MTEIELPALHGRNPLGLFAALGVLDIATRSMRGRRVTLRWTDHVDPVAIIEGPDSIHHLIELCDVDRARWANSPVLTWGPNGGPPIPDLKMSSTDLRSWLSVVADSFRSTHDRTDGDLLAGLVAEGAMAAGKPESKPTHLRFTTGQQQFMNIARGCLSAWTTENLAHNLSNYDFDYVPGKSFRWDSKPVVPYALGARAPSKGETSTVLGIEWLAFLALKFFPVAAAFGRTRTTGCSSSYKNVEFTWPLWSARLTSPVVASILADSHIRSMEHAELRQLGVLSVWTSPIQRIGTGEGYGSFGAPGPHIEAMGKP